MTRFKDSFRNFLQGLGRVAGFGDRTPKAEARTIQFTPDLEAMDYLAGRSIPSSYFTKRHTRGVRASTRRALAGMRGDRKRAAEARIARHVGPHGRMP